MGYVFADSVDDHGSIGCIGCCVMVKVHFRRTLFSNIELCVHVRDLVSKM